VGNEKQKDFFQEFLVPELPGILAWAVRGCLQWREQRGLHPPPCIQNATQGYRQDMDIIGAFLDDCCIRGHQYSIRGQELLRRYQVWCEELGERPLTGRAFSEELSRRGIEAKHRRFGTERVGITIAGFASAQTTTE